MLALVGQGRNVKALFRRAVARRELSLVDAARSGGSACGDQRWIDADHG